MKKRQIWILVLLALVILGVFLNFFQFQNEKVLVIKPSKHKEIILPVPGGEFTLTYTHSVHQTPVYEVYVINENNELVLIETRFSALGVGMPFAEGEGIFENTGREFKISGLNRTEKSINMLISPIPAHAVIIEKQSYPLLSLIGQESFAALSAKNHWKLIPRKDGSYDR